MDDLAPVQRLTRDLAQAAATMSEKEAKFLVDSYYLFQDDRKRAHNQVLAMEGEPHSVIAWLADNSQTMENQIKRTLEVYTESKVVGRWLKSIVGVGPVIAAGLLAHIDIKKAPTAGHIWSFAGLNPDAVWEKKQKRPWNADLKVVLWKAGQSFMKFSAREDCVYGHVYRARKQYEIDRNESGGNAETAARTLREKSYGKTTEAYKAYIVGKLPPGQIDARARRYAVKLLISHLQVAWWFADTGKLPVDPYPIAIKGHVHYVPLPNPEVIPGLFEALRAKGWN